MIKSMLTFIYSTLTNPKFASSTVINYFEFQLASDSHLFNREDLLIVESYK